jgi:hypothetical protein
MTEHAPSEWPELHATRTPVPAVDRASLPVGPGVIAFYRRGRAVWFGRSAGLRATFKQAFATTGPSAVSPLRRAVAIFLDLAPPLAIRTGRYRPPAEDHALISAWLRGCEVGWKATPGEREAVELEFRLLREPSTTRSA